VLLSFVLVDSTTQGIPTGTFLEIGDLECRFFWKKMPCPSEARMDDGDKVKRKANDNLK
jgi:hypothetical protein